MRALKGADFLGYAWKKLAHSNERNRRGVTRTDSFYHPRHRERRHKGLRMGRLFIGEKESRVGPAARNFYKLDWSVRIDSLGGCVVSKTQYPSLVSAITGPSAHLTRRCREVRSSRGGRGKECTLSLGLGGMAGRARWWVRMVG